MVFFLIKALLKAGCLLEGVSNRGGRLLKKSQKNGRLKEEGVYSKHYGINVPLARVGGIMEIFMVFKSRLINYRYVFDAVSRLSNLPLILAIYLSFAPEIDVMQSIDWLNRALWLKGGGLFWYVFVSLDCFFKYSVIDLIIHSKDLDVVLCHQIKVKYVWVRKQCSL